MLYHMQESRLCQMLHVSIASDKKLFQFQVGLYDGLGSDLTYILPIC